MNSKTWIRIVLFLVVVVGTLVAFSFRDRINLETLDSVISDAGILGPILFMAVYALATVLFFPGAVLTLAGGALFGPLAGTFLNLTGATLGATLAFLIARYLASDWATRKAGGRLKQLIEGVEKEGWRFVAFTRLVPLFPFILLNYALGLTRIKILHYVLASYLFMLPGAFAYTYLGYAGREAVTGGESMIQKILLALALVATVAFMPRLIRRFRAPPPPAKTFPELSVAELKNRLDNKDDILILDVRGMDEYIGPLGHIAGSKRIALNEINVRMEEIRSFAEHPLAVVCRTDRRTPIAIGQLDQAGFKNLFLVRGGMVAWNKEGFPVER